MDHHSPLLVGTGITGRPQPGLGGDPGPAGCSLRRVRQPGCPGTGPGPGTGTAWHGVAWHGVWERALAWHGHWHQHGHGHWHGVGTGTGVIPSMAST